MVKNKLIVRTNKPVGFIITDSKGRILKKGGPYKKLVAENKKRFKKK